MSRLTPAELAADHFLLPTGASTNNLPLALVVEDNRDVIQYIISCIKDSFRCEIAYDGQQGIDKAIEMIPDIIISDVMMPKMNGYELCQTLKEDKRTSHIPIILLTAKADISSKLEGLKEGADAYLTKPFNEEELIIRLQKLTEIRRSLQERYRNFSYGSTLGVPPNQIEDEFLLKVRELIENNISDSNYGIIQLCRALSLSRSQLFRKLKALTGKSTSIFIRSIRLEKAKILLLTTDLNVSEVAYDVGFTSPAYFTKAFSEEFGHTPSKIRAPN